MKLNMKKIILVLSLFLFLIACQTVSKKIDEKMEVEEKELTKWINKSESQLKVSFGSPDKIEFKENSRNRFYIYVREKLKIKCERTFEINPSNKVVGYSSKNCF